MKKISVVVLCMLSLISYALVYAEGTVGELSDNMVRFHIIANSDSEYDQAVKLDVRDYVCANIGDYSGAERYAGEIMRLANERLAQLDVGYRAQARVEKVFIPRKSYKNITLPAGRYRAVRLILGRGEGENWWCVAYPPLCFSESTVGKLSANGEAELRAHLSESGAGIIFGETEYRLWVVDFAERLISGNRR